MWIIQCSNRMGYMNHILSSLFGNFIERLCILYAGFRNTVQAYCPELLNTKYF